MTRARALAGAAAVLAACLGSVPAAQARAPLPDFRSLSCAALGFEDGALGGGVDCGVLAVPEVRGGRGRTLRLAVVIARATDAHGAIEPILYLHGGPGIATLDVVPRGLRGKSLPRLRRRHDLIFFDQRGTGRSTPAICPSFNEAMDRLDKEQSAPAIRATRRLAAAATCRAELKALGVDPRAYRSADIADDAEALRTALGIGRWSIFATSFGSLPAAELVKRAPGRVRALFLDSAYPPNSENRAEQVMATAESYGIFQMRCDASPSCRSHHPGLLATALRVAGRLDAAPIRTERDPIDGDAFLGAVWTLMVDGFTAPFLPELLGRADGGDEKMIRRFVKTFGSADYFGRFAHDQSWLVNCHDIFPRPSAPWLDRARAAQPRLFAAMVPDRQDEMCDMLQPRHAPPSFFKASRRRVPTLILFGEFDPATSRSDALVASRFFPGARLVEVAGASHAPFYTDECTKGMVEAFFDAPERAVDASCLAARPAFSFADAAGFDAFLADLPE